MPVAAGFSAVDVGALVAAAGMGMEVDIGAAVFVDAGTIPAGVHEARIKAASKTGMFFLIFIDTLNFVLDLNLHTEPVYHGIGMGVAVQSGGGVGVGARKDRV